MPSVRPRPTKSSSRTWRAFTVRPRAEKKAADRLRGMGLDVLLPTRTAVHQWSDRKKRVEVPLFPGYVFAEVDERERIAALETSGVVRTVSFGGRVAEIRAEDVAALKALADMPERIEAVTRRAFPPGAQVIVTRGPLKGVRGEVVGHPRRQHLLITVESIRQTVRVEVPEDWAMRPAGAK